MSDARERAPRPAPGAVPVAVARRLADLEKAQVPRRIWARDPTVWKDDPATPEIRDRLGWLSVSDSMTEQAPVLAAFAAEIRASYDRVVLCGMGGSSLAALVLAASVGAAPGYPALVVLDSTDPRAVAAVAHGGEIARTLFLIASKSGTTLESDCFFRYFWEVAGAHGPQFAAITDPGTPLAALGRARGFRRVFLNPPDIGGRYAALSYFGLVPAALLGIDVGELLRRARHARAACGPDVPAEANPGARLGAMLATAALEGRDKLTFAPSRGLASFGLWAEQLVAESTGKEGRGVLPVVGEPLGPPDVYGPDRIFVSLTLAGEDDPARDAGLAALEQAGHPVVRLRLADPYELGGEFFRWEFATATLGAFLRVNPFDQPNVAESKANTDRVLASREAPAPVANAAELGRFLATLKPPGYLALMAYVPPTAAADRRLALIQGRLRDRLRVATTLGYGPRLLHSTGQFHKGGPPVGSFLQITEPGGPDVSIPGRAFTFGALAAAQAEGDLRAHSARGRPVLRIERLELLGG